MEFFIFGWLACAIACWVIANNKARFAGGWFILSLFLGFFALIILLVLPSLARDKSAPSPDTHVKCPDCRQLVPMDARVCFHCRCKLIPQK